MIDEETHRCEMKRTEQSNPDARKKVLVVDDSEVNRILVERIVEAHLAQSQLTRRLLDRVVGHLKRGEKDRLETRVKAGVTEGLDNSPWDDTAPMLPLCDLNEPVRFRQSLYQKFEFPEAAWGAMTYVTKLCRN